MAKTYYNLADEAFNKLASYIYFDKQNLLLREKLALFISQGKKETLKALANSIESYDNNIQQMLKDNIGLAFLPKSVIENKNLIDPNYLSKSFYTNYIYKDLPLTERLSIFIDVPFEVHIISVMWLLRYGRYFDEDLTEHCIGNRLDNNASKPNSRLLFKRYEQQYQGWWSNGIDCAKQMFSEGQDVTILNFDFKDYYHSVELDLDSLERQIKAKSNLEVDNLHLIFIDLHKKFHQVLQETLHVMVTRKKNHVALPIGLLSSSVLANWYLKEFDEMIVEKLNPNYYGRYVDDLMIVIENTIIDEFNASHVAEIDTQISFKNANHYIIYSYITKYLRDIFTLSEDEPPKYSVRKKRYSNLSLQSEKFFIYQFNNEYSPQLLNKFVEDQEEKSSAFQFLSDDDDSIYKELEKITFESNFQGESIDGGGLKDIEENRFKLSVYLSKISRGSVISGSAYDEEEADKVKKYFRGYYLLKHYIFWEKILSLWIVREDSAAFYEALNSISEQIQLLTFRLEKSFGGDSIHHKTIEEKVRRDLTAYFYTAVRMSVGLFPDFASLVVESDTAVLNRINDLSLYRRTWLLRKSLIYAPLIQFSKYAAADFPLYSKAAIDDLLGKDLELFELEASFFPYRIKLNECCQFMFMKWIFKASRVKSNQTKYLSDFLNCEEFLDEAFDLFCHVNSITAKDREAVKNEYYIFTKLNRDLGAQPKINGVKIRPIKIPNSTSKNVDDLRVCLVNKYVDFKESEKSLDRNPVSDFKRFEEFNKILDDVKKVKEPDLFIMPEICLPYHFIPHTIMYSVYNQIGFISGVEHWTVGQFVFNFVLTVLPIKVEGDRDAIVIPRLKNHYAPEEENIIVQVKKLKIPKPQPYNYELVMWRNTYFSIYYCFELADVRHRNILLGFVDVLFAPVWNKDIHYYNSLVESASRDMHCFIVLANTTQYGDSRITRPADHIRRDKLRIKGGTIPDHKAIVVVSDLEIQKLREFQIADSKADKNKLKEQLLFKPLPPDFPMKTANFRHRLVLFEVDREDEYPF